MLRRAGRMIRGKSSCPEKRQNRLTCGREGEFDPTVVSRIRVRRMIPIGTTAIVQVRIWDQVRAGGTWNFPKPVSEVPDELEGNDGEGPS